MTAKPAADVRIQVEIPQTPNGSDALTIRVLDARGMPLTDVSAVTLRLLYLDGNHSPITVKGASGTDGDFTAALDEPIAEGMVILRVHIERQGQNSAAVEFPIYRTVASVRVQADERARALLLAAETRMNLLGALRSLQELNDGQGGLVVTESEFLAPNLSRVSVEGEGEAIAAGGTQYFQAPDGDWNVRERLEPYVFPNFGVGEFAERVRFGPTDNIGGRPVQVVRFEIPSGGAETQQYAYWIDAEDALIFQIASVAPGHYLVERFRDWDAGDIVIWLPLGDPAASGAQASASPPPATSAPIAKATAMTAVVVRATASASALPSGLVQTRRLGELAATVNIQPHVFEPTRIGLELTGQNGQPAQDVTRVDLALAMQGMNHGAMGIEAVRQAAGKYRAEGMLLAMEGSWHLAVQVTRADGAIESGLFVFRVPNETHTGAVSRFYERPEGEVEVHDIAVYPQDIVPRVISLKAGHPVRLFVMFVDYPFCGPSVLVPEYNLNVPVSPDGLGQLEFVPTKSETLELVCDAEGLILRPQD